MPAYLLGYDIGSSSVKVALIEAKTGRLFASASSPDQEMTIQAPRSGWGEQHPDVWWQELVRATHRLKKAHSFESGDIVAIGIAYQMHGLVAVDKDHNVLRPAIIWCDSRAVAIGEQALHDLGEAYCLDTLLNSPGNFTASKLRWVKEHEPAVYEKIHKIMLPGDYIALRLTGEIQTTASGLSEGILWDFKNNQVAHHLLDYFGLDESLLSEVVPTFGYQAGMSAQAAEILGLKSGTPVTYRAGDQPNNAFSLNVLRSSEVAATAGTSGVVYGITKEISPDQVGRINTFVHVNNQPENPHLGVLACVNGTGILNSWLRRLVGNLPYNELNSLAAQAPIGADNLYFFPFGNGAERILGNANPGANLKNLSLLTHQIEHVVRAAQEGIVFALTMGLHIMESVGVSAKVVRAGQANMFLSPVFREAFVNTTGATLELYNTDGAQGAARGAGIGAGVYATFDEAFASLERVSLTEPDPNLQTAYTEAFNRWHSQLQRTELSNV
ncbi:carbohydrate kinase [Spirosoma sp. KCTC 42546]|uniref:xylulokinase n=1 Tax=Spirosoma sp. KCTC 42546 TaxID=2520506 RepID=UPI0011582E87|nr:FGGY family carbohydrate kinase [Spirosoma sp. KCTC 42546]QDK79881.1 carbohydrate kinase [Spirosoma sp. KCTC 42546]